MSQRTLTPLASCPVNLHPINLLSSWWRGGVGVGSVCLPSIQALPDVVLLGTSEGQGSCASGLHQNRSREPAASSLHAAMLWYPCSHVMVPLPAPVLQASLIHLWFLWPRSWGILDTIPSFEPAVLVLLILASSQPCSTSEDQKAVPGPRADPEWCWAPQACWAAGRWLCWDRTWL